MGEGSGLQGFSNADVDEELQSYLIRNKESCFLHDDDEKSPRRWVWLTMSLPVGGRLFVFVALEHGYLWLTWECIHLTKAQWCRTARRIGLSILKRTLRLHLPPLTLAVLLCHAHATCNKVSIIHRDGFRTRLCDNCNRALRSRGGGHRANGWR